MTGTLNWIVRTFAPYGGSGITPSSKKSRKTNTAKSGRSEGGKWSTVNVGNEKEKARSVIDNVMKKDVGQMKADAFIRDNVDEKILKYAKPHEKAHMLKCLMKGYTCKKDEKAMALILKSSQKDRDEFGKVCKKAGGTEKLYNELFRFKIIESDKRPSYSDHINTQQLHLMAKFGEKVQLNQGVNSVVWQLIEPLASGLSKKSKGKVDYSLYFDLRFPETMAAAEKKLKQRIERHIRDGKVDEWHSEDKEPNFPVKKINEFGGKYGDKEQTYHEKKMIIGKFWIKVKDIKVTYKENGKYSYKATMYVHEQTGTKASDEEKYSWLEPVCGKRWVNMGEWTISGDGKK